MRRLLIIFILAVSATGARADRYADCEQSSDLDRTILGCSEIIDNRGREDRDALAGAYSNRGSVYFTKGNLDRAIDDYTKAIEIKPKDAGLHYNLANVFHAKNDFDRAITAHTKAIQINPKYADAYNNRGTSKRAKRLLDGAIDDYKKAILINPRLVEAHVNIGVAYGEKREYEKAIAEHTKAIMIKKITPKPSVTMAKQSRLILERR